MGPVRLRFFVYPINYVWDVRVRAIGRAISPIVDHPSSASGFFNIQCRNHYLGVNLEGNYCLLIIHYALLFLCLQLNCITM